MKPRLFEGQGLVGNGRVCNGELVIQLCGLTFVSFVSTAPRYGTVLTTHLPVSLPTLGLLIVVAEFVEKMCSLWFSCLGIFVFF